MIKNVVLALASIGALFSGFGMVSAFEAHTINVTAHVENALQLSGTEINMGGSAASARVFPEEWLVTQFTIFFSESFCADAQTRVKKVDYDLFVTDKPGDEFKWLGDAMYIGIDVALDANKFPVAAGGALVPVDPDGTATRPILVVSGTLNKGTGTAECPNNTADIITIGLDVPVFEGFYNQYTDVPGCVLEVESSPKKPSGLCTPSVILTDDRNVETGIKLGVDIIIQVSRIYLS